MNAFVKLLRSNPDQKRWRFFMRRKYRTILEGFRDMGKRFDNSPTCLLSDEEIWKIYSIVSISFDQIADQRKEKLPDDCILYIIHCYLERYEFFKAKGSDAETDMFEKLNYETTSYLREGVAGTYELIDPENEIICGGVIRDDDEG